MQKYGWLLGILALTGCTKDDTDSDVSDTDTVDTDVPFEGLEIQVAQGESTGDHLRAAVYRMKFDDSAGDVALVEDLDVDSAAFSGGTATLHVPNSAGIAGDLFEDGTTGSLFVVYAYDDVDNNETQGLNEPIRGTSKGILVWVETNAETSQLALTENAWNGLELQLEGLPSIFDPATTTFDINGAVAHDSVTFGGTVDASVTGDHRLTVVPIESENTPTSVIYDAVLTNPWTVTFDDVPPADWLVDGETSEDLPEDLSLAIITPAAYVDSDSSGSLTDGDNVSAVACIGPDQMALLWVGAYTLPSTGFYLSIAGLNPGWSAVDITDGGVGDEVPQPLSDATNLVIGGACAD